MSKPTLNDTDCESCLYPQSCPPRAPRPSPAVVLRRITKKEGAPRTSLVVGNRSIPVLQGDPKWLPKKVLNFVCEKALFMEPSAILICNGSVFEAEQLADVLVKQGVMEKLSAYDNVYLTRTDPKDTARVEKNTYICTEKKEEVEAARRGDSECELARWISRGRLAKELDSRFIGCMRGRTMYVIPFSMGPIAGRYSRNAVQLTDSPYVVLNMRMVTRVSSSVWDSIATSDFVRCVHSMGVPRPLTRKMVNGWPCNTERVLIAHYLPENEVWSYGSGYGGNSLLGKKCLALRIGSYMGWKEGWLAEHAATLSITDPCGKETFICVSFPSGAGKTVLATIVPSLPGYKVQVLGDDIAWLRWDKDGQLYSMPPENGMFGIAADTRSKDGENIIKMVSKDALLVNAASTSKGRFMWQGIEETLEKDEKVIDWKGKEWKQGDGTAPAHPNSRFTVFSSSCPNIHPSWDSPTGVPISAYIFGTRRPDSMPLVMESPTWSQGVTLAAGSRTQVGNVSDKKSDGLVHDPMSMRPFMSYNFAKYVEHWLSMEKEGRKMPKLFHVNWYQPGPDGKPIWPGYGENIRVLDWILKRVHNAESTEVVETPVGLLPKSLNMEGLSIDIESILQVKKEFWTKELEDLSKFYDTEMGEDLPAAVHNVIKKLTDAVNDMK